MYIYISISISIYIYIYIYILLVNANVKRLLKSIQHNLNRTCIRPREKNKLKTLDVRYLSFRSEHNPQTENVERLPINSNDIVV